MTTRSTAQGQHQRFIAMVLEMDIDKCANTYGTAPCTAAAGTGNECYNTYATCQDKAHYSRTTVTKKFCSRGVIVPGETVRPYISDKISVTPTEIDPSQGLAMRSKVQIKVYDEPCPDNLEDPYYATRTAEAAGTFWSRLMARNNNIVGRVARLRQGYVTSPWDWSTFNTQLFLIDSIAGPDSDGAMTVVLSDMLKIADRNVVPAATDGALAADLPAVAQTGTALGGSVSTIALATAASAVDDAYKTMEVWIYGGTGAGQRRVISGYVGSTRVATMSANWDVAPDVTSAYQVAPLQLTLKSGKATQYTDPATSGKSEYIRIGDEIIGYTAISGDTLSWPDSTYRAQWGSTKSDHQTSDGVQLCRAWISKQPWEVLRDIFVESGLSASYLDLTGWLSEDTSWFNGGAITAIISSPEKASSLLKSLLQDINAIMWWSPTDQLVKLLANQPSVGGASATLTDDNFISQKTTVERQDTDRITQSAIYFGMRDSTANTSEPKNYYAAAIAIDLDAQSANEYGDTRPDTSYSRWLTTPNSTFARTAAARRIARLRNAPYKFGFYLDPKDEQALGSLINISTRRLAGPTGAPATTLCRITQSKDVGTHFEVEALSVGYARAKYGFISANGMPDYASASAAQRNYAFISNTATSRMTNGDNGYFII